MQFRPPEYGLLNVGRLVNLSVGGLLRRSALFPFRGGASGVPAMHAGIAFRAGILQPEVFVNQDHRNPPFRMAFVQNEPFVAYPSGRCTIHAPARFHARRVEILMTCRIAWGGRFADTPEGGIAVLHDFVPTDGQDDVPRSEGQCSSPSRVTAFAPVRNRSHNSACRRLSISSLKGTPCSKVSMNG